MKRWLVSVLIVFMTGCSAVGAPTNPASVTPAVPDDIPTATATLMPAHAWVTSLREELIRSGPGRNHNFVGSLPARVPNEIGAISEDGQWVLLLPVEIKEFDSGFPASRWVELSPYAKIEGDITQLLVWKVTMTPTFTPSPTPSSTPSSPLVFPQRDLILRAGPGEQYAEAGTAVANMTLTVYAISGDGSWLLVSPIGEAEQWLAISPVVSVSGNLYMADAYQSFPTNPPAPFAPTVKILAAVGARLEPDSNETILAFLESGQTFEIVSRSTDGGWYGITLPDTLFIGWIPDSASLEITGDLASIPPLPPPPSPTGTPSPTAMVKPSQIPTVDEEAIVSTAVSRILATLTAQVTATSEPD